MRQRSAPKAPSAEVCGSRAIQEGLRRRVWLQAALAQDQLCAALLTHFLFDHIVS